MMKEIALGSTVGLMIFLAFVGINIMPLVFLVVILGGFYYFTQMPQGNSQYDDISAGRGQFTPIRFEDIGGQDTAIQELQEALRFVLKPESIADLGIRPLKGILLVGPPGTGKTLLAKAAASYTESAFVVASGSEFIEIYAGVGAKRVRKIFKEARRMAKATKRNSAIIFIDELEVLGSKRGSHSSHMEYDQTLNQLLVEMDGLNQNDEIRVLLIGATNRADLLDPALVRPGRFDRQVQVNLPDKQGRIKILDLHTRNKPLRDPRILEEIGQETFGFSGAHLESLANEAAILAMREKANIIDRHHFSQAVDKVLLGEKSDRQSRPEEKTRIACHESGHALVSECCLPGSVSSLTIIPRGNALGFMRKNLGDDQVLFTREDLEKQIMVAIAGALAEEIELGGKSTGAKSDFNHAWGLAQEMVGAGLSSLGIVGVDQIPAESLFEECRSIISDLETRTRQLLMQYRDKLQAVASFLLEEEKLDRAKFLICIDV